jgi:hypothetical protein
MSTTETTTNAGPAIPRVQAQPEPQPWLTDEDAKGWTLVARGRGKGKKSLIGVEIHLDRAQSEWLQSESKRTGLPYTEVVTQLVEQARQADERRAARAKKKSAT